MDSWTAIPGRGEPKWTALDDFSGTAIIRGSLERQLFCLFFDPGGRPRRFAAPVFSLGVRFAAAVPFEDVFR